MAGPYVDPVAGDQISKGVNSSDPSPLELLNRIGAQAGLLNQKGKAPQMTGVEDPSLMSYEHNAEANPHVMNMHEAAEAAKQKYMQDNGVDENGNVVAK